MESNNTVDSGIVRNGNLFYVYILKGVNDWHYCGITNDIYRRYTEHNNGESISTRKNAPYVLRWLREVPTRQQARFIEVMIKKRGVRRFITREQFTSNMAKVNHDIEMFYFRFRRR